MLLHFVPCFLLVLPHLGMVIVFSISSNYCAVLSQMKLVWKSMLRGILLISLHVYIEGDLINSRITEIIYIYIPINIYNQFSRGEENNTCEVK